VTEPAAPRLFGTDGVRGVANVDLTLDLAVALGRATARELLADGRPLVVGRDTRRSGPMLEAAIVAGATSAGADVHLAGVLPTPALAHVAADGPFGAAIMVSASHNPADDNGLKVLDALGRKLDEAREDRLEAAIRAAAGADRPSGPRNAGIGRVVGADGLLGGYLADRRRIAAGARSDLRIVVDCANGAGAMTAPEILAATGASVEVIHDAPDGVNINAGCGATQPESLAAEVVRRRADLGFALDGDADRLVAVDRHGQVVDGDRLLGLCALDRIERGALAGGLLVVTTLSNGGLEAAVTEAGGRLLRTPVGDKYILEAMLAEGASLGGEKSGHVIVMEHASTGDGLVTALEVLGVLGRHDRPIDELAAAIPLFPQQQRAVHVRRKDAWADDPTLVAAIADAERRLAGRGRVLVRPSGTEPALRVMVEGEDEALVAELADALATIASERLH
jgi:phosphoglucosamine mutase